MFGLDLAGCVGVCCVAERKESISDMCQGLELRTTGPDRVRSGALDLPGSVGPCSQQHPIGQNQLR